MIAPLARWIALALTLASGVLGSNVCDSAVSEKAEPPGRKKIAKQEQRGTAESPLVVKTIQADKPKDESEREQEKLQIDRDMRELAQQSRTIGIFVFVIGGLQVWMFWRQLKLMRQSTDTAEVAAEAAKISAEVARKQFAAAQRPQLLVRQLKLNVSDEGRQRST